MRNQESKNRIKADNLEAHILMLKGEMNNIVALTNEKILETRVIETQVDLKKKELAETLKQVAHATQGLLAGEEANKNEAIRLSLLEESIVTKQMAVVTEELAFKKYKDTEVLALKVEEVELEKHLTRKNQESIALGEKIEDQLTSIERLHVETEGIGMRLNKVESDHLRAEEDVLVAQNALVSVLKSKEVLEVLIKELEVKNAFIIKNIEEREINVTKREADAKVIVNRLKKLYKVHYPGIDLKI